MKDNYKNYSRGVFILMSIGIALIFPAIVFLLSGNLRWIEGWIYSLWFDVMMLTNMIYMYTKNPTLFSERLTAHGSHNQEKWDRTLLISLFVLGGLWLVAMPLDALRMDLSPLFPVGMRIIGGLLLIPAFYFIVGASIANPYLSTVVRFQSDLNQKVITTGVYNLVRHPQYLGIIILMIGGPCLLGSILGIVFGIGITIILIKRIKGEEKMLEEKLDGYVEYQKKVKYRLLPYIW
jgi:protein-S-isoprenylcysteine O-methyltransferase Ste14